MCIITFVGCFGFGLIVMKTCNWSIIRLSSSAVHPIKNHAYNIISASEIQQGIWQILNKMTVKTTNKLNIVIFFWKNLPTEVDNSSSLITAKTYHKSITFSFQHLKNIYDSNNKTSYLGWL